MAQNPYENLVEKNPYEEAAPPPRKPFLGAEGRRQAMREALEADVSPLGAKVIGGAGAGIDEMAYRLKQLLGGELTPEEAARVQGGRDLVAAGGVPAAGGMIAANLAVTGGPAASLYRGATGLAGRLLPQVLAKSVGAGVTGGTVAGLTQPVLEGESTAGNVGMGMAGGVLGDAVMRGGARLLQPIIQSDAVQTLLRHGVVPTMGQAAGGFLNRIEQGLQSVVGPGYVVGGARQRAAREFNRAALNQAVPGRMPPVTTIGHEGVGEVGRRSSSNYERLLANRNVTPDEELARAIVDARQSTVLPLSEAGQREFDQVLKRNLWDRMPLAPVPGSAGAPTGTSLVPRGQTGLATPAGAGFSSYAPISASPMKSEVIGDLGKAARKYLDSDSASDQAIGEALMNARNATQQWMLRNAGVSGREIAAADTAYMAQKTVEDASRRALARGGEFSPLELLREARTGSASERLGRAAQEVLPGTVPNSGTVDRLLVAASLGLPAAGVNEYFGGPGYLTALLASPLLYSRPVSRYLLGDLIPGQVAGAQAVRGLAPYAAQAGGLLLSP